MLIPQNFNPETIEKDSSEDRICLETHLPELLSNSFCGFIRINSKTTEKVTEVTCEDCLALLNRDINGYVGGHNCRNRFGETSNSTCFVCGISL